VAGLAPSGGAVRTNLLHPLVELAFVYIFVTAGATQALPVINEILGLKLGGFLVAIGTDNRDVPARQRKPGLLMLCEGESGRLVPLQIVALIAGIEIRRCNKLTGMAILMTIGAIIKLYPVQRVLAFWNMALRALHTNMTALERVLRRSVLLHGKQRGLPALDLVTSGAFAGIRTLGELTVMSVLVAIGTLFELDLLLEIPFCSVADCTDIFFHPAVV